jgi:hypothetical protein
VKENNKKNIERKLKEILKNEGPYSRNLVSILLMIADRKFGKGYANSLIDKYGLDLCGFNKKE